MTDTIADLKMYTRGGQMMRDGLLEQLTDADLAFSTGGDNPTLGELFKQNGENQHSYTQSLKKLTQDWTYRHNDPMLTTSLARLKVWFQQLDTDMAAALDQLEPGDLSKQVDRGNGVIRTVERQIGIYSESMLIFLTKVVVYFRAMEKPLPPSVAHYIG
ncbi:MAG: hypothetical protein AAFV33_15385 [Chloroflexota bacterium]